MLLDSYIHLGTFYDEINLYNSRKQHTSQILLMKLIFDTYNFFSTITRNNLRNSYTVSKKSFRSFVRML